MLEKAGLGVTVRKNNVETYRGFVFVRLAEDGIGFGDIIGDSLAASVLRHARAPTVISRCRIPLMIRRARTLLNSDFATSRFEENCICSSACRLIGATWRPSPAPGSGGRCGRGN